MADLKGWKEVPIGGVVDTPASSRSYATGAWRVTRPILDENKCINCMQCWLYCPDMAISGKIADGKTKMIGIDLKYCKGCGTCAVVCPVKAIDMKPENEFLK
jgi:pyruvate ferredoxin oxidoreductase delta subunit